MVDKTNKQQVVQEKKTFENSPCFYCMNYMAKDLKIHNPANKYHSELIFFVEQIKDEKVCKHLLELLKIIASPI